MYLAVFLVIHSYIVLATVHSDVFVLSQSLSLSVIVCAILNICERRTARIHACQVPISCAKFNPTTWIVVP